jgi:hypothetical protein
MSERAPTVRDEIQDLYFWLGEEAERAGFTPWVTGWLGKEGGRVSDLVSRYAETEESCKRDADPDHRVCGGKGWHWGWDQHRDPVRLRCPCVDQRRAEQRKDGAA